MLCIPCVCLNCLSVCSHELRTPLHGILFLKCSLIDLRCGFCSGIVAMSQIVAMTSLSTEQAQIVDSIRVNSNHLWAVINGKHQANFSKATCPRVFFPVDI